VIHLRVIAVLSFCILSFSSLAAEESGQAAKFELENTHKVLIRSPSGEPYELIVSLPGSYDESSDRKYPVLYYTDAYWDAPLLTSLYLDLTFDKAIPEFIMVGISYPGDVNYSALRSRDLTPTKNITRNRDSGGGPDFLKFIKETVVPKIETEYRTQNNERAIAGWSFGGLFALYALYSDPSFFKRYIAISPATLWDDGFIGKLDDSFFSLNKELSARVFISYGEKEDENFSGAVAEFQKKIEDRQYKKIHLANYMVKNMGHAGSKSSGYAEGLVWIWKDIKAD
jgi:predicted alpha/beta superfamily hydrolase